MVRFSRSAGICRAVGPHRHDEGADPDQEQAEFLEKADNLILVEEVGRGHDKRDDDGKDEEDIEVLAPVEFLDDDVGEGKDGFHT